MKYRQTVLRAEDFDGFYVRVHWPEDGEIKVISIPIPISVYINGDPSHYVRSELKSILTAQQYSEYLYERIV